MIAAKTKKRSRQKKKTEEKKKQRKVVRFRVSFGFLNGGTILTVRGGSRLHVGLCLANFPGTVSEHPPFYRFRCVPRATEGMHKR